MDIEGYRQRHRHCVTVSFMMSGYIRANEMAKKRGEPDPWEILDDHRVRSCNSGRIHALKPQCDFPEDGNCGGPVSIPTEETLEALQPRPVGRPKKQTTADLGEMILRELEKING